MWKLPGHTKEQRKAHMILMGVIYKLKEQHKAKLSLKTVISELSELSCQCHRPNYFGQLWEDNVFLP